MTFKQWWDGIGWSFAARILFKPIGQLFAEIAWNAAVKAEREACAKVCEDSYEYAGDTLAKAIRARGQE
jgi:hypothetical protein